MTKRFTSAPLVVVAVIATLAAAVAAQTVLAPLSAALLIVAVIWPLQAYLEHYVTRYLAIALSLLVVVTGFAVFGYLSVWAISRVARWTVSEAGRFQEVYAQSSQWLEAHGIAIASVWDEYFNASRILRTVQGITARINSTASFWIISFVYVLLILLEVKDFRHKAQNLRNVELGQWLLQGTRQTAAKLRRYMLVRMLMSLVTGLFVWMLTGLIGLHLAAEWGVIAFLLNFIPFIGPFLATTIPTIFAVAQFDSWPPVLGLFISLNIVQFIGGSYIEPRVAGSALSISPVLILLSVFLWANLWGAFGAFIGVPISIAVLSFCSLHPSSHWLADLLGAAKQE